MMTANNEKDYINRYAVLNAINDAIAHNALSYDGCVNEIMEFIAKIPAADVRPVVKAHWYWDKDGMDWNIGAWRCSACKAMSPMWWNTDRGSPMHKSGHKFCPNCGADMRNAED